MALLSATLMFGLGLSGLITPPAAMAASAPVIVTTPTSGAPGRTIQVNGRSFPPLRGVSFSWDGSTSVVRIAAVRADGTFASTVTAPTSGGDHVLRASARDASATTSFRVLLPTVVSTATPSATPTPRPPTATPPPPTATPPQPIATPPPPTTTTGAPGGASAPAATPGASPSSTPTRAPTQTSAPVATATPTATAIPSAPPTTGRTFYVSPSGSDSSPGTETQPWKTLYKAGDTLQAGDTAIFEDGVYPESQIRAYSTFRNSGTASAPITIRARNKHGAVIKFIGRADQQKLMLLGQDYITIQDFQITQDVKGTNYDDVLVRCWYRDLGNGQFDQSDHCSVIGNKIYNAVEPVKVSRSTAALFEGNTILGARVAFGSFNTDRLVFRNNEIVDPTDDGVQTKGGTRSAQVYNNLIRTTGANTLNVGIYLGGGSCATCGIYDANGYEGYGVAAYNNVVASAAGIRYGGIVLQGCDGCAATNNVVVGPGTALRTIKGPGWGTNPVYSRNPTILDNIVQDCTVGADIRAAETTGTVLVDYNDFHGCGAAGVAQVHAVSGDPQFVDKASDWHLGANSTVRGAGTATSFRGYFGETVPVSVDRDGLTRVTPWSPGIYR